MEPPSLSLVGLEVYRLGAVPVSPHLRLVAGIEIAAAISLRSTTRAQKAGKLRAFQQVTDRGFQ
jgi:hypothetical protein